VLFRSRFAMNQKTKPQTGNILFVSLASRRAEKAGFHVVQIV